MLTRNDMDLDRPTKTLADYIAIVINPVLIMVLVHSLCFFLVDIFYRAQTVGGVRWVLFWFVLAVVLIARIGIEQGDTQATVYGLLLATATWLYLLTVQTNPIFGALLLGIVWFTAHKITCNCTLVDDEADASGQGLMQSLRKVPAHLKKMRSTQTVPVRVAVPPSAKSAAPAKKPRKPQVPGVWLIYFSAAALPLFGLGQTLLPAGDMAARHRGFVFLFCYLAAALGLLITTSFLGLRRYLRQRYVVMPGYIAFGWIRSGLIAAVIVLCSALLLPRPGAGAAWATLRYHIDYRIRQASEYAARFNPHGHGPGRPGNEAPPAGSENPPSGSGNPGQSDTGSAGSQGNQPSGQGPNPGTAGQPASGGTPGQPMHNLSPAAGSLYPLLKVLFYLVVIVGFLWLLYRYRTALLTMAKGLWKAIGDFIASLLGRTAAPPATAMAGKSKMPRFQAFKSPFLTGADRLWPPEQLIAYTYDALQSWALEKETPRSPQTPREFCRQLGEEMPEAAAALEHLALLYGHVAYGASLPAAYRQEHLRLLWDCMATPRPKGVPAGK